MQQQQDGGGQVDARARDPNRFYCPYPGCNRSFAELWRLKVHYRAPPDVRGSGKERGHGTELKYCPKCNKELKAGKHHVGCSAGRPSVRASSKKKNAKQSAASMGHTEAGGPHFVNGGHFPIHDQLYFDHDDLLMAGQHQPPLTIVVPPQHGHAVMPAPHYPPGGPYFSGTTPLPSTHHEAMHDPLADLHGEASTPWASSATAGPQGLPLGPHMGSGLAEPSGHAPSMHRAGSHALPSLQGTSTGVPPDNLPNWPGFGNQFVVPEVGEHIKVDDDHTSDLLGVHGSPSPPPLPPDWDASVKPSGLLFDFDSFNVSKQHHHNDSRPFITVTSAINPTDMIYPSDDYIMQILFGDANEPVPRRMTTHLHQFDNLDDGLHDFDNGLVHEGLDELLSKDLDVATPHVSGGEGHHDLSLAHRSCKSKVAAPPNGKGVAAAGCDFPVTDAIKLEGQALSIQP